MLTEDFTGWRGIRDGPTMMDRSGGGLELSCSMLRAWRGETSCTKRKHGQNDGSLAHFIGSGWRVERSGRWLVHRPMRWSFNAPFT
jgi:hypothetical protein